MPGILAIDQATTTGWAYAWPGDAPVWDHEWLGRGEAWEGRVFSRFRSMLERLIKTYDPKTLAFEAPFLPRPDRSGRAKPLNPDTLRRAYGWVSLITMVADEYNLDIEEHQSPSVAKFFTGHGRFDGDTPEEKTAGKKRAMRDACIARGWRVTDDEADALGLLMFVEHKLYPRESLSRRAISLRVPKGPLFAGRTM